MNKEILFKVITNGIKSRVQVSEHRRAKIKYWKLRADIPYKYQNNKLWIVEWNDENEMFYVVKSISKDPILANPRSAGKPRYIPINAQRMYQGMHHSVRSKMIHSIKDWFRGFINKKDIKPLDSSKYPFYAHLKIMKYDIKRTPDVDNLGYVYMKCFMDVLKVDKENDGLGIVIDDGPLYYLGYCVDIQPVNHPSKEKMVFQLIHYTF
mgnify:CR=1 FL=1